MEDKLHWPGGTYGWDPLWRGEIHIYGEGDNHCIHSWIIICFGLLRLCFLLLFSTRVFSVENPYLILREGEVLELHFLISKFCPSYLLQLQCSFYLELGCVVGAAKEDLFESFLGLFFNGELVYPLEDQQGGLPDIFSYLWH